MKGDWSGKGVEIAAAGLERPQRELPAKVGTEPSPVVMVYVYVLVYPLM